MDRVSRFAIALALMLIEGALSAQPIPTDTLHRTATTNGTEVLWFQDEDDEVKSAIVSQNVESGYGDIYDARGADDFVVPEGETWFVTEVRVTGDYWAHTAHARSENVAFYRSGVHLPGELIRSYRKIVGREPRVEGSFEITLPDPVKLGPGRYWLSVQANLKTPTRWGWKTHGQQRGKLAAWKNPGEGFNGRCGTYRRLAYCSRGDLGPDFMFAIVGVRHIK